VQNLVVNARVKRLQLQNRIRKVKILFYNKYDCVFSGMFFKIYIVSLSCDDELEWVISIFIKNNNNKKLMIHCALKLWNWTKELGILANTSKSFIEKS
jgi:hypothetical protein